MYLNLKDLEVRTENQSRVELDKETMESYAERMQEGAKFPPLKVFKIGERFVLAGGFHRYNAALQIEEYEFECEVQEGTEDDLKLWRWADNKTHGKPRTIADKQKCVTEMLTDSLTKGWSDRKIAKHADVSHTMVAMARRQLANPEAPKAGKTQVDAGKTQAKAGKTQAPAQPEGNQDATESQADEENKAMIEALIDENDQLTKKLAVATLPVEDQDSGARLIDDLRAEIKLLMVELESVKASRDRYQWENAELKKQVAAQQKQLKKLQG